MARLEIYGSKLQKQMLKDACKTTGISQSALAWIAITHYLKKHQKGIERMKPQVKDVELIQKSKDSERKTGDYVGSFEKESQKLSKIEKAYKHGRMPEETKDNLIKLAKRNYARSRFALEREISRDANGKR